MKETGLSLRERRFVDAYLGSCGGNASAAARAAGYAKTTAEHQACRLLGTVGIRREIDNRLAAASATEIATSEERDKFLTAIMRATDEDVHARIKAVCELNKSSGRHAIRHAIDGRWTLEQTLTNSRQSE